MVDIKYLLTKTKFKYLWISQILSQVTINMMNFLILIKLFDHTGSTLAISLLWISYALPTILVGPIASAMVDILDRRKVIIIANFFQFVVILFSSFFVQEKIFLLYGVTFMYSLLNQFYVPSESAYVPKLVGKEHLPQANSLFFLTQQMALIVGFSIAGFVNTMLGFNLSLFVCSFLILMATISVLFLPKSESKIFLSKKFEKAFLEFFRTFFEGYTHIRNKKSIYLPLLLLLGAQACFAVVIVCVPVIAQNILVIDTNYSGILLVVPAAIGAIIGAVYFPKFLKKGWRKRRLIETGALMLGILFLIYALFLPFIPQTARIVLSLITTMFIGVFFIALIIPTQTFLQETTPNDLRGRIFGNMWFLITITQVIPIIFSGALVEIFGVNTLLVIVAAYCLGILYLSKNLKIKLERT